jgi:hypothetical protein
MRLICRCVICLALLAGGGMFGCNRTPQQTVIELPPMRPLTVEEWKKLPVDKKYEPYAFEQLKLNDPQLKGEAAWDAFMRNVIMPERDKDIPRK